jgi:hypothetical protein
MTRIQTKSFGALAAIALATTGVAYAQKPLVSTKDPVKSQIRVKSDPLKADVKSPGTAKVTVKGPKK